MSNPANLPVDLATPDQFPSGFVYVEEFLSLDEQNLVMQIIDQHGFDQHVHRKQQFFGPKYYHTPQSYRSELQPIDESLSSQVLGKTQNTTIDTDITAATDMDTTSSSLSLFDEDGRTIGAKNLRHSLGAFQWLIDKLITQGLFERADVRDPFVEYVQHDSKIRRVERDYIDPNSNPLSPLEYEMLEHINSLPSDQRPQWGENTPYPDQILVNEYLVGQNIGQHFDDQLCFGPLIVGVSCGDDCTLILSRPQCIGRADAAIRSAHLQYINGDILHDIEDLAEGFFNCHQDDFFTPTSLSNKEQQENPPPLSSLPTSTTTPISLSYPLSLRDFSQNSWSEGDGPSVFGTFCRCTRDRALQQFDPYGKLLLDVKRRKEWAQLQQFPQFAPALANQFYNTNVFYQEFLQSPHHPNLDLPQDFLFPSSSTSTSTTTISSTTPAIGNANARKRPVDPVYLKKQLEWLQKRAEKEHSSLTPGPHSISIEDELIEAPQYVRDIVKIILDTPHHPTTDEEMNAYIMSVNFESLLEQYYTTHQPSTILSSSQIRAQVKQILSPTLVDINTCVHCDDTLYIPVKKGSVYVLAGASRYHYRHAIKKSSRTEQKSNPNYRRVSLTVRSLLPGRRQVEKDSEADRSIQPTIIPKTIDE